MQVEIAFVDQHAVVVEVGGGLRTYSAAGLELLDGYRLDQTCTSGRGQVLIPWPNRIQNGSYRFGGRRHQLPLTELEARNAIHGLVRWAAWTVREREPHRVVMGHVLHPQPGYPFSLGLAIEYALSDDGLSVSTTATNLGPDACLFGSGAHPYLTVGTRKVDSTVLHAPGRTVIESDARGLPSGVGAVENTDYDFRRPRRIGTTVLDHTFTDLERDADGLARVTLRNPRRRTRVTVWADAAYPYMQLFTGDTLSDVDRRSLAVEPMTCPANAFRTGEGLIRLEPGASFVGRWGITPSPVSRS